MKSKGILREFTQYASLGVLGMLGLSCYILADTFFVARGLGANGLAALNLAIPVYSFIHGSGLMLGMGGATKYAVFKSRGREEEGHRAFTHSLFLACGLAAIFLLLGAFCSGAITRLLGADEAVFEMCRVYLQVILLFAPMFLLNNVLLCFVRNDGAPRLAMLAMIGGSLSNVVLDYLFIFPLGMGIFGTVLATGIAPIISMAILSPYFLKKRNLFRPVRCAPSAHMVRGILSCGLPSLITELSSGIVMIAFNTIILRLEGNTGVAAYGVIANLSLVVLAIYTGIAQGIQPLLSRSHGRGEGDEARALFRWAVTVSAALSAAIYAGVFFGAGHIAALFNSEQNALLQSMAESGLKLYFTACFFAGFNILVSATFTATERTRPAHIISLLRGFFLIIPLAFLLSALGGMTGVWCAFPLTEGLTFALGLVLYRRSGTKSLGAKTAQNPINTATF